MFCDGIAPGSDLTILDQDFNYNSASKTPKPAEQPKKVEEKIAKNPVVALPTPISRNLPQIDDSTGCFIPSNETSLPPTVLISKTGKLKLMICSTKGMHILLSHWVRLQKFLISF